MIDFVRGEPVWAQKYRPQKIADCVLPDRLIDTFQAIAATGRLPHMILAGQHGVGKTTVARALCNEIPDTAVLEINASMNSGIDTLRNDIKTFASTATISGGNKVVILDEADYLNAQSTQPALRAFMEEFSKSCTFILTCNYKGRIIEPLHSRCTVIDFTIEKSELPALATKFLTRVEKILHAENIPYDKKALMGLILKHLPDWRRILNELQRFSASGRIDNGVLSAADTSNMSTLFDALRNRRFSDVRKWVAEHVGQDADPVFRSLYDSACRLVTPDSVPTMIILLADYSYKSSFVADQEVNMTACLAEVMTQCDFV